MPRRAAARRRRFPVVDPPSRAITAAWWSRMAWPGGASQLEACLFLELRVDPVHLRSKLLADHLDLVAGLLGAHASEILLSGPVLGDPLAREVAGLYLVEYLLHRRPRLLADDPLAPGHVAVFGRV